MLRKMISVKNSSNCHSSCRRVNSATVLATLKCAEAAQATTATVAHTAALKLKSNIGHRSTPADSVEAKLFCHVERQVINPQCFLDVWPRTLMLGKQTIGLRRTQRNTRLLFNINTP